MRQKLPNITILATSDSVWLKLALTQTKDIKTIQQYFEDF